MEGGNAMCLNMQIREAAQQISRLSIVAVLGVGGYSVAKNQQQKDDVLIEEIIVTGTFIRGSSTTGALPISVINRTDLEAPAWIMVVLIYSAVSAADLMPCGVSS